jgi:hypothetical protein
VVGGSSEPLFTNLDVRIPKEVVEQGVKALKDSIRPIATIEGDEDTGETGDASNHASKSEKRPSKTSTTKDSRLKTTADVSPSKNAAAKDKKPKTGGK